MKLFWNDVLRNFSVFFNEKISVIKKLDEREIGFRLLDEKQKRNCCLREYHWHLSSMTHLICVFSAEENCKR